MTYTFIGNKDYIEKEVKKISEKFSIESIIHFNIENSNIKSVIEALDTISLFGKKLIIVDNIDKLEDEELLIKYLNNQSTNTLIITSYKELKKRKKLTKTLQEKSEYKELLNYNLESVIKENLKDYKMSNMVIGLLISYCNNNLFRIENELEKLKIYKIEEKEITKEDVESLVKKSLDASIFDLIDSINLKNKDKVFKIYDELLEEGETEEKIMYTIANHYRLLFQISEKIKNETDTDIINDYQMHPYRLTKLKEQLSVINEKDILSILKRLSKIDIKIKKGEADIKNMMFVFFKSL